MIAKQIVSSINHFDLICFALNYSLYTIEVPIPCVESFNTVLVNHFYPFDSSVIVTCNERGKLLLNKCASSLHWDPFMGTCTFEQVNSNKQPLECLKMKCLNGGKCVLNSKNETKCVCIEGYVGEFCENNIDDCASNPCTNNSTCVDGVNRYHCICEDKYIDKSCYDLAAPNPCKLNSFNKTEAIIRLEHPFASEKYLVCNPQGFAQVLSCPDGLVWSQMQQTCLPIDTREVFERYAKLCRNNNRFNSTARFEYQYSKLKYAQCSENGLFKIEVCPTSKPYFCKKLDACVEKYFDNSCAE